MNWGVHLKYDKETGITKTEPIIHEKSLIEKLKHP